ncbi:AMP binding protein [Coprinellus micaceus]|uniref:AMP binding protein n=1 Tax=Coprinellus micaceus TaxID=71717 RepID=A0A4Y7TWV6_COPMI|nr:AMP binding protein [Coprinellus micaceus]
MAPKIYKSPYPDVPIPDTSIFTHLFSSPSPDLVGNFLMSDIAYVDTPSGTALSRGQVKNFALQFAFSLLHGPSFEIRRGDTSLIYSPNSLAWPVALFGSAAAGVKVTLANSAYNAHELSHQYKDSGAKIVYTAEEGIPVVLEMFKDMGLSEGEVTNRVIVLTNSLHWTGRGYQRPSPSVRGFVTLGDMLGRGFLVNEERFDDELANETVYMCYSSGTTGKPKGVETTHRNITSVLEQTRPAWPSSPSASDRFLGVLPFYHIFGAVMLIHFPFLFGYPVYIMPRFDPEDFALNIEKYKITTALVVPPILVVLKNHPCVEKFDISSLEIMLSGAAPLGIDLVKAVKTRLESLRKDSGKKIAIVQGYGLTETSPTTHILPAADHIRKGGSIGRLLPNLEARLMLDGKGGDSNDAEEGQPGELWVRGPSIMKGYRNNAVATEDSITRDGWFKTGDIAIRDAEGYFAIVDRRKELIKYKGYQVPPAELESILLTHPDIADAAVIGVESVREATELPRAYIVQAHPDDLFNAGENKAAFGFSVQKWIKTKVARHKFLRGGVVVIETIPKSASGKILRRELRDRAKEELAGRDPAEAIVGAKL